MTQGSPNKYTPPARRPPNGQPGVPGVPVDPAIISSEISSSDIASGPQDNNLAVASQNVSGNESKSPLKNVPQLNQKGTASKRQSISPARQNDPSQAVSTATKDVEHKVLGEFKDFANSEKIRYSEARRNKLQHDKQSKINDLMKFAKHFKLQSEVPKDLVPILAKDPAKQDKIVSRAKREAEEVATAKAIEAGSRKSDSKTSSISPGGTQGASRLPLVNERADFAPSKHRYPPQQPGHTSFRAHQHGNMNPLASPPSGSGGFYNHRQQESRRQQQPGGPIPVPQPLPPPGGPRTPAQPHMHGNSSNSQTPLRTPTSAISARFNPAAHDFKPNPGANAFQPGGKAKTTGPIQASSPSAFFGSKKPLSSAERPKVEDYFKIVTSLEKSAQGDPKAATNGGIKPAYTTPPTWIEVKPEEETTSYKDLYGNAPAAVSVSPQQHVGTGSTPLPHQHQLPLHLQQGSYGASHMPANSQAAFPMQAQHHGFPNPTHHDEHRMQYSASTSLYNSPRGAQQAMAYQSPGPRHAPMYAPNGAYVMAPGPGQPHYLQHMAGHPQVLASPMHFPAPLMAPSMSQQGSQQGYNVPPQGMPAAMYTPPNQHGHPGQVQPPGGYSPNRMAPQMMRQGSRPGQHQQMFMNTGYPQQSFPPQPHSKPVR